MCISIRGMQDILKHGDLEGISISGRPAERWQLEKAIKDAQDNGYEVIPPCNNVDKSGHCMGHNDEEWKELMAAEKELRKANGYSPERRQSVIQEYIEAQ
jgi:hypothetical protein